MHAILYKVDKVNFNFDFINYLKKYVHFRSFYTYINREGYSAGESERKARTRTAQERIYVLFFGCFICYNKLPKGEVLVTYYQILKQRRIDLKLSVQDVSMQTRLAPEYIVAIEENNLDVFSDDYSFVRYFVHSYAGAIGVNWDAISTEVDQTIKYHAHKKNMALTQAQRQIVENMPKVKAGKKTKKRGSSHFQSSISRTSRSLHWSKRRLTPLGWFLIVLVVGGFIVTNAVSSALSVNEEKARESERQAELQQKEQETQRLSQQRKETQLEESKTALSLESVSSQPNTVYITSEQAMPWVVQFTVSVPSATKIEIYRGDELVAGDASKEQTSDFSTVLDITEGQTYRLVVSSYNNNAIALNGQSVAVQTPEEKESGVEIVLNFGTAAPEESNSYDYYGNGWYDEGTDYSYDQSGDLAYYGYEQ